MTGRHASSRGIVASLGPLVLALALCACGTTRIDVESLPRSHAPLDATASAGFAPALIFGPGAAWITGIDDSGFELGSWVSATPGPAWPTDAERPVLAVGRVVERRNRWARVELMGVVDPMRQRALEPRPLAAASQLPTVTKRLVPVQVEGGELHVAIGSADLVTGQGVYGVLPQTALADEDDPRRLAARLSGLARLAPLDPHTSQVVPLAGAQPASGDRLVLLGVAPPRETTVEILLAASGTDALEAELARRIQQDRLAGVRVVRTPAPYSEHEAARALAERHGDRLVVVVYATADGLQISAQHDRVRPGPNLPLRPVAPASLGVSTLAAGILAQVHDLRGEHGQAVFTLEQALAHSEQPVSAWSWLGPALVRDYVELWRGDWALEAILALEAALGASDDDDTRAGLAEAALVASLALPAFERRDALADALEALHADGERLSPLALEALARHANLERRWNEADRWLQQLTSRAGQPGARFAARRTRLLLQISRGELPDDDALQELESLAAELGPLRQLQVRTLAVRVALLRTGLISAQLTALVEEIDAFGAPALGVELLTIAAQRLVDEQDTLTDQLMLQAAAFAQAARRPLAAVAILAELENLRLEQQRESPITGALAELYLSTLATADRRLQLGRRALYSAQHAGDLQLARDALALARELFFSIGDDINTAITELRLARLELDTGRPEAARQHVAAARSFEPSAQDASLRVLREQLEEAISAASAP